MGNTQSSLHIFSNHNASLRTINSPPQSVSPRCDVFINHRGSDVKETIASLIFHNLKNKGLRVFLDKNSIQTGHRIPESIEQAIRTSSVHIAIFSPNYADSCCCLNELDLILATGVPVIPVFCGVRPYMLRMEDEDGAYARALQMHNNTGKVDSPTIQKWKKVLGKASHIKGYIFKGDQGELLEKIAMSVIEYVGDSTNSINLTGRYTPRKGQNRSGKE